MLGVILLTLVAQRQCGVAQVQSYAYAPRAVAAAPVYQQTYSYQYQQPAYADIVQFVAVADPYYSEVVGQQLRAENKAKAQIQTEIDLATQVTKLAEAVARLEARAQAPPPQPITPFTAPPPPTKDLPPPVKSAPPPTPSAQIPSAQTPESFSAEAPPPPPEPSAALSHPPDRIVGVFRENCQKCHTQGPGLKGDFALFTDRGDFIRPNALDMIAIDQQVYSGKMPPKKPLDETTYSELKSWMNNSHDEIMDFVKQTRSPKTVK